jgi:hypothetical protein
MGVTRVDADIRQYDAFQLVPQPAGHRDSYPGGSTLRPGMTFGYSAGRHLADAGQPAPRPSGGQRYMLADEVDKRPELGRDLPARRP